MHVGGVTFMRAMSGLCERCQIYASGVRSIDRIYKSGKSNTNADALSRNPVGPAIQQVEEVQVAAPQSDCTIAELLVS